MDKVRIPSKYQEKQISKVDQMLHNLENIFLRKENFRKEIKTLKKNQNINAESIDNILKIYIVWRYYVTCRLHCTKQILGKEDKIETIIGSHL